MKKFQAKALGLTEKVDKLSSLVDRQKQYSRRNCILIHCVKENQNEDTDETVINKKESEVDLEISPGGIDRTHIIGVPSKDKIRPIIVCKTNGEEARIYQQKRLKGKNMSVTASLTKIRISTLKEAGNKFGYSSVWTADGKIMYKEEGDTKAKVYFD